jgi:hypothetical protein
MANWWEEKDEFGYTYADKNRPGYMGQAPAKPSPAPVEEDLSEEAFEEVMKRSKGGYEDPLGGDDFGVTPDEKPYIQELTSEQKKLSKVLEDEKLPDVGLPEGEPDILREVDDSGEDKIKSLFQKAIGAKGKQRADGYANVYEALQSYQGKDTPFLRGLRNKFSKKASQTRNKTHLGDYVDYFNRGRSWVARRRPARSAPVRAPAPTPQPQTFSQVDEFESEIGQRGQRAKSLFEAEVQDGHSLDFDFDQPADTDNLSEDYSITDLSSVKDRETGTVSQLSDSMSFSSSNIIDSDRNKGNLRDGYYIPGRAARPKLNVLGIPFVVSENHLAEGRGHGAKYGNYTGWKKKVYPNGHGFAIKKNEMGEDELVKLQDGKKWNIGLDMYNAPGTPRKYQNKIVSFAPGTVVQIDDELTAADKDELRRAGMGGSQLRNRKYPSMWGRRTIIRSDEVREFDGKKHQIYFQYGHGAKTAFNNLKVGDNVKLGDVLGDMGTTNQNGAGGVPKHIDVHAFILVRDKDGKSKKVFLSPTEWLPKGTEARDEGERQSAQMYEDEKGDVEAAEEFVDDVDIDPLTGEEVPKTEPKEDFSSETIESVEAPPKDSWRIKQQQAQPVQSGQMPSRDAGAVESGFEVEDVVEKDQPTGVVPSQDPDVVQDVSLQEKMSFGRDLRDNPDQIEEMGELELSEALNKLPKQVYHEKGVYDAFPTLRANLSNRLGKISRGRDEGAVGVRETQSLMAEPKVKEVESDISVFSSTSPKEDAEDFVSKAQDLLANEMERYKSKEFELSKIDPKRFWTNATTGQKIWGAIGVMLGAIGGAMAGQPNNAAKMIQKMIDADIDAQKDSNENKRLMKNEAYRRVTMAIDQLGRAENRKFQKEKLGILKQQVGIEWAKLQQGTQKHVLNKSFGAAAFRKGGIPLKSWNIIRAQNPELAKRLQDMAVVIGDKVQFALNKDLAKTLNATIKDMRLAGKSIERLGDLSEDINWGEQAFKFWNAGKIEEARAHARGLIGVMRESVVGGGVMTEQDRKLIESLIPNPDKFFRLSATNRARLKFLFNKANDNVAGALKSAGITIPVERNIKLNKANIKQHLKAAKLPFTPENIRRSIKILKKNKVWKSQSPLKYLLQG